MTLSHPVVVEKDMETKKNPGATEKAVADEVYAELRKNLVRNGIYSSEQSGNTLNAELLVHYINEYWAGDEYFRKGLPWYDLGKRGRGGQIIIIRANLKNGEENVAQINSLHNTGTIYNRRGIIGEISTELAAQIEKILKEGITVGNTQSP